MNSTQTREHGGLRLWLFLVAAAVALIAAFGFAKPAWADITKENVKVATNPTGTALKAGATLESITLTLSEATFDATQGKVASNYTVTSTSADADLAVSGVALSTDQAANDQAILSFETKNTVGHTAGELNITIAADAIQGGNGESNIVLDPITINAANAVTLTLTSTDPASLTAGCALSTITLSNSSSADFNSTLSATDFEITENPMGNIAIKSGKGEGTTATLTMSGNVGEAGQFKIAAKPSAFVNQPAANTAAIDITVGAAKGTVEASLNGALYYGKDATGTSITLTSDGLIFNESPQKENFTLGGDGSSGLDFTVSGGGETVTLTLSDAPENIGEITITVKQAAFQYQPSEESIAATGEINVAKAVPTITAEPNPLIAGVENPTVTLTSDFPFGEGATTDTIKITAQPENSELTLTGVQLNEGKVVLSFSGTTVAGSITLTITNTAFTNSQYLESATATLNVVTEPTPGDAGTIQNQVVGVKTPVIDGMKPYADVTVSADLYTWTIEANEDAGETPATTIAQNLVVPILGAIERGGCTLATSAQVASIQLEVPGSTPADQLDFANQVLANAVPIKNSPVKAQETALTLADLEGKTCGVIAKTNTGTLTYTFVFEGEAAPEPPAATSEPVYRLYNDNDHLHLYTSDQNEIAELKTKGWVVDFDGAPCWYAPLEGTDAAAYEIIRLYNPYNDDHYFVKESDTAQINMLLEAGMKRDGDGSSFWSAADTETNVEVSTLFNPFADVDTHLYSPNQVEIDSLLANDWELNTPIIWGVPAPEEA